MKKRIIDLREGGSDPLLDIVSYGRGGRPFTPDQKELIARTVRRVPEVMVKVSGGARTIAGVEQHVAYIGGRGSSSWKPTPENISAARDSSANSPRTGI